MTAYSAPGIPKTSNSCIFNQRPVEYTHQIRTKKSGGVVYTGTEEEVKDVFNGYYNTINYEIIDLRLSEVRV